MTNEEALIEIQKLLTHYHGVALFEPFKVAISALEKQIPKKPKNVYIAQDKGIITYWECPRCKRRHRSDYFECATSYCDECGQKICWTEDENDNT